MQFVGPKMTLDFSNIIHRLSISTCCTSSPSRYRLHCTSFSTYLMQVYTGASREPHNALQCALWRGAGPPCGIYILRCWAHWFGFDYLCGIYFVFWCLCCLLASDASPKNGKEIPCTQTWMDDGQLSQKVRDENNVYHGTPEMFSLKKAYSR